MDNTHGDDYYPVKLKVRWQAWLRIQEIAREERRDPYEQAAIILERAVSRRSNQRRPANA